MDYISPLQKKRKSRWDEVPPPLVYKDPNVSTILGYEDPNVSLTALACTMATIGSLLEQCEARLNEHEYCLDKHENRLEILTVAFIEGVVGSIFSWACGHEPFEHDEELRYVSDWACSESGKVVSTALQVDAKVLSIVAIHCINRRHKPNHFTTTGALDEAVSEAKTLVNQDRPHFLMNHRNLVHALDWYDVMKKELKFTDLIP